MYKIKVKNNETGKIWWEYGFNNFMMKRINFLQNDVTIDNYHTYEILENVKIILTWDTFKKCLFNKAIYLN